MRLHTHTLDSVTLKIVNMLNTFIGQEVMYYG